MLEKSNLKLYFIKHFIPSWFASVMGTGILAIASFFYSKYLGFLKPVSYWIFYFNIVLFLVLLVPWTLRWILFHKHAIADLNNPILNNFYPTIAAAFLVLSANFLIMGKSIIPHYIFWGELLWFIGVALTLIFSFLIPFKTFTSKLVELHHVNPGMFIPPVALIVIPIPGAMIVDNFHGIIRQIIFLTNLFGWGAGFFLFIALFAISLYRFILHHPLPDVLAPTIWINLGPIGAGTSAFILLVKASKFIQDPMPLFLFIALFWAFGLWWVFMSIIMTIFYLRKLKFPYTMAWWALTFPLGAFVSGTHAISNIFKSSVIDYLGFALFFLLVFFWIITLIKTIIGVISGKLFLPK